MPVPKKAITSKKAAPPKKPKKISGIEKKALAGQSSEVGRQVAINARALVKKAR